MAFREVLTVTAGKSRSAASSAQLIARDASRRASISGEIGESSTTEYLDEANLFIGDLAKEVTEEELETAFGRYGRVLGVDVKRDRATSSSLGYGFVQYSTRREASEGKRALHRHEMHGRSIRVGWAQKNTNLFVGDLDASVTNDKLRTAFRAFGPIVEEDTFMKGDNYGFVRFRHRVHAEQAKLMMEGYLLGRRPVRIGWGEASTQRNCVHVQFDTYLAERYCLRESDLEPHFREFGEIESIVLPRGIDHSLKGYGFVHFADTEEGEAAAEHAIAKLGTAVAFLRGRQARGPEAATEGEAPLGPPIELPIQCHFGRRQPKRAQNGESSGPMGRAGGRKGNRSPSGPPAGPSRRWTRGGWGGGEYGYTDDGWGYSGGEYGYAPQQMLYAPSAMQMQVMMMHGGAMGGQPVSPHQMGQMASAQGYVAIPHLQMPAVLPPQPEYAVAHYHFCASPCSSPAGMLNKGPGSPTDHPQLKMLPPHMA